jgi:hypothetical protein
VDSGVYVGVTPMSPEEAELYGNGDDDAIQRVMHEMPYGLYIVGSKEDGGKVNGMMADWVMQVSSTRGAAVSFENTRTRWRTSGAAHFPDLLAQDDEEMELARAFAQPFSGAKVSAARAMRRRRCTTSWTASNTG